MDRTKYKNIITFRLVNRGTGEIEYELIKEYDLFYISERNFLHSMLDKFFYKLTKLGDVQSYGIEFFSEVRKSPFTELPLPF